MLSKRTIIGLVVGSIIMGIGALSLVQHIGTITIEEEHYVKVGESSFYTFQHLMKLKTIHENWRRF